MAQLAFYISTKVPSVHSDPDMKGFRERFLAAIPLAYAEAEKAPGFVAHANQIAWNNAKSEFDQDYGPGARLPCRDISTEPVGWA